MLRLILILLLLVPVGAWWILEDLWRRFVGFPPLNNCFAWAARIYEYDSRDGLLIHKSASGWFPHFVVVRHARTEPPADHVHCVEFVPVDRVPEVLVPPRQFVGEVRETRYTKD